MVNAMDVGDLCWAKMKGFSPWPAKIAEPVKDVKRPNLKKPMHYVYFFGTKNHAWILDDNIFPYEEFKDKFMKQSNAHAFKAAVQDIVNYSQALPKKPKSAIYAKPEIVKQPEVNGKPAKNRILKTVQGKTPEKKKRGPKPSKGEPGVKVLKVAKKRRLSESSSSSSISNRASKKVDQFTALLASTPPNSGYSMISPILSSRSYVSTTVMKPSGLLNRPAFIPRPATPPLDVERMSEILKNKNVQPSLKKFGFLGLGIMGKGIVKNLINSGHKVTVWNRTPLKCRDFVKAGAMIGQTPADVVEASDITFSCLSDPEAVKELVFGNCGVIDKIQPDKGYVEMTSIDPDTSQDIAAAIIERGGKYLEAPLSGSKKSAEDGTLIILVAGDRSLYTDCKTCFEAMGKHVFYLGDVGNGAKMNLALNMVLGTTLASLAEAMSLADRIGLSQKDLLEILELGPLNCVAIMEKGQAMIEKSFPTNMRLQHIQKDLRHALGVGDQMQQPLPLTAAANEVYKHAKRMGYGEHDVSAIYMRARF